MAYFALEKDELTINDQFFLPPQEVARLFEIAQTGASGSVHSLRDFLGLTGEIQVNCLSFLPFHVLLDRIALYYQNHIGFHLRFSGEISGEIYTFFRDQHALMIIERMLGRKRKKSWGKLNRIEISVLSELANIISNSFWRSLAEQATLNWWITPPVYVTDLCRSISNSAKVHALEPMLIHFEYLVPSLGLRTQMVLLPNQHTLKKILNKLTPAEDLLDFD